MKKIVVKIKGITDTVLLATHAKEVDGDVIVHRGKFAIDAKSVLGVLSIDMSTGVIIEYPEDATDFENFIKEFEA